MVIGSIKSLGSVDPSTAYGGIRNVQEQQTSFADQLKNAVAEVDNVQTRGEEMVEQMVTGQVAGVHEVMITAQESQLAFELLLEIRNKLLESYQEIMRMQV